MDETRDFSLYNRIIKSENNSAVIQNILLVDICPYLVELIKILAFNEYNAKRYNQQKQLHKWEKDKIYIADIENLDGKINYNGTNVLTNEKLEKFASGKPIAELINLQVAKETDWLPFDYGDIDIAGICKILRNRIDDKIRFNGKFKEFLGTETGLGHCRNAYGGHLTENLRKNCSLDDVKNEITNIETPLHALIEEMEQKKICFTPKRNENALKVLSKISNFLKNMQNTIDSICECKITKDNEDNLYDAKDLYPYHIFLAYPSAENDKFRRFCNDVLRTDHAKSGKPIFTDQGTIAHLTALSISKSDERSHEAKKICKELLEPMQREGILKVLRLSEEQHNMGFIDLEPTNKMDVFIKKLQKVEGNICVITDNIDLADEIWNFNANDEIENCSAVAMRVFNKEKAVPFYK